MVTLATALASTKNELINFSIFSQFLRNFFQSYRISAVACVCVQNAFPSLNTALEMDYTRRQNSF